MTTTQPGTGGLEVRSIDYVPPCRATRQGLTPGPLWFTSNAQIATLAVGLISITEGASRVAGRRLIGSAVPVEWGRWQGTLEE